jgi:hypothetical protein
MTIAKPRARQADAFVAAAPDSRAGRWQRGSRTQLTLSIAPELLERVDEIAHRKHLSRSALLTVWINDRLEHEAS